MGFFNAITEWQKKRYENHRAEMESLGKCPDCNGRGFLHSYSAVYMPALDCGGCSGTGLYSQWEENE